ncbi:MAG: signal recognition particle-docking protein FtsY [Candidatus Diapherotrites archaeon]|nr:signal recognition particle-docking protein FtsY [Candidatus Diapherotrites archaeon]
MFDALKKSFGRIADTLAEVSGAGITLDEKRINEILDDMELELLQADVAVDVLDRMRDEMVRQLSGKKVKNRKEAMDAIRDALAELLALPAPQIAPPPKKPYIILFVGPNGVGKTTTIAKIAYKLKGSGYGVVIAAADTFRAGSIEQTEEWAKRIGVRVVKHDYGADPAAVAYDAVKSATARGEEYVLIDTAGRQDTNENLMEQLKKIKRVVKPDLTIYVGEALTGNALLEQLRRYDEEIGIDGVILTKMDADTRGGSAFTVTVGAGKPLIFVGFGESPDDLKEFNAEELAGTILGQ